LPDDEPEGQVRPSVEDDGATQARLAEARLQEALAAHRKLRAEAEGYRERITRNVERRYEKQHEELLLDFIDILDNLDRALAAAQTSYADDPLIGGLILVRSQLLQTLQDEGLERIPVLGRAYDPHFSEAVDTEPVEDPERHQVVVRELLRGYRLNGKVARPSRVVVGEYRAAAPTAPAEPAEPGASPAILGVPAVMERPPRSEDVGEREADLGEQHHQVHVLPGDVVLGGGELLGTSDHQVRGVDAVEHEHGAEDKKEQPVAGEDAGEHAGGDQQEREDEER
jgi:molecular chaperone GrpE